MQFQSSDYDQYRPDSQRSTVTIPQSLHMSGMHWQQCAASGPHYEQQLSPGLQREVQIGAPNQAMREGSQRSFIGTSNMIPHSMLPNSMLPNSMLPNSMLPNFALMTQQQQWQQQQQPQQQQQQPQQQQQQPQQQQPDDPQEFLKGRPYRCGHCGQIKVTTSGAHCNFTNRLTN